MNSCCSEKKTRMTVDNTTQKVMDMYSEYPYPLCGTHRGMFETNVYPLIASNSRISRILEAGCGTGNVALEMGRLLPDISVTAIDITQAALDLAIEKSIDQGVSNVRFLRSNLLEYDPALGAFDFIHCQGVIHHLSDPVLGMRNLNRYLTAGGYAYVWVYMLQGRRYILDVREILGMLPVDDMGYEDRLEMLKKTLAVYHSHVRKDGLKRRPPHQRRPARTRGPQLAILRKIADAITLLNDRGLEGLKLLLGKTDRPAPQRFAWSPETETVRYNTGLVDTFLHPHDVFFRMKDILKLFSTTGFDLVRISDGMSSSVENCIGRDHPFFAHVHGLPLENQLEFIEIIEKPSGVGFLLQKSAAV